MSDRTERKYFGYGLDTIALGSISAVLIVAVFFLLKDSKTNKTELDLIKKELKNLSEFSSNIDSNISQQLMEIRDVFSEFKNQECKEGTCFAKEPKQQQIRQPLKVQKEPKKQSKVIIEEEYESESSDDAI